MFFSPITRSARLLSFLSFQQVHLLRLKRIWSSLLFLLFFSFIRMYFRILSIFRSRAKFEILIFQTRNNFLINKMLWPPDYWYSSISYKSSFDFRSERVASRLHEFCHWEIYDHHNWNKFLNIIKKAGRFILELNWWYCFYSCCWTYLENVYTLHFNYRFFSDKTIECL